MLRPPPGPLGPALTLKELATEMRNVESGVDACGRAVNAAPGRILVNLVIHGDGRVISASVTGRLANTPLSWCAERTVRFNPVPEELGAVADVPVFIPGRQD